MRAVIIGAGIGGLAAAVALRRVGIETLVIERAAGIREVGAGLFIWLNAVNALRELGLEATVTASASVVERNLVRTPAGDLIAQNDFGAVSRRAGASCIGIHRAVLQKILLDSLPPASIRLGARCCGFEDSTAILENGERIKADVLVGADGISSLIRDGLHGAEAPRYAGYTCWRGIRPRQRCVAGSVGVACYRRRIAVRALALWPGTALLVSYQKCASGNCANESRSRSLVPRLGRSGP